LNSYLLGKLSKKVIKRFKETIRVCQEIG